VPSIVISHRDDYHWTGEVGQVGVTLVVGVVLAWRVKLEAEQRQRAERTSQELTVSEQKYRSIFENAGDPILVCSRDGTIIAANEALADLAGARPSLAGASVSDLFGDEGARQLTAAAQTAGQLRLTLKRPDGSTAIVDAACTSLGDAEDSTVQAILHDVTEQEQTHQAMRAYVREVTNAQEEERTRIARELHDDTAQSLVLLCRGLDVARAGADDSKLEEMRGLADSILEGVRRFSRDLRPSILDDLGLLPAIEWIADEASQRGVVHSSVEVAGEPRRLSSEAELVLFRIAQEALRNAEKHAGECSARITIEFRDEDVQLSVADDGRGFESAASDSAREGKLGLLGMRERAELLGADLRIESAVGKGTSVTVLLRN
jgi:PAS domain S-box-containing protein